MIQRWLFALQPVWQTFLDDTGHHLQLNLTKTELLMVTANPALHHDFSIQLGSSTITPSRPARDDKLSFTDHIATTARSCRFALYNIRKIRPFLSEQAAQLLVQALVLSRLDYCNSLLEDLLACVTSPVCRSMCMYFECVCAAEGVVCIHPNWRSWDPDWPPPNWSGSGSSEKDLPKQSRRPNVCHLFCFDLGSSVIVCALWEICFCSS